MTIPDSAVNARQGNMSALTGSQSVGGGPEQSQCCSGCCGPIREVKLRHSVWVVVFQENRPLTSPVEPRSARGGVRLSLLREQNLSSGRALEPVRAGRRQKRSAMIGPGGSKPRKLKKVIFLLPRRLLFHARFRFERRNPRLERRCLDPDVTGVPP